MRSDLRLLESTLQWTEDNRTSFSIPADLSNLGVALMKPLGELATVADVLVRAELTDDSSARAADLLEFAWNELQEGRVLYDVLDGRPDLIILVTMYASFARHGFTHRGFVDLVRRQVALESVRALELAPWRKMEIADALTLLDIRAPWDSRAELSRTWLAHMPEPWALGDANAYSVTHTVFYASDFGFLEPTLDPCLLEYLALWVPTWIRYYDDINNMDLLGEFLMVSACLRRVDIPGVDALARRQLPDGSLPGPHDGGLALEPGVVSNVRRSFLRDYHTTLVGLLAATMTARVTHR